MKSNIDEEFTTIRLTKRTIKRLIKQGKKKETYDQLLNRLMDGVTITFDGETPRTSDPKPLVYVTRAVCPHCGHELSGDDPVYCPEFQGYLCPWCWGEVTV